jgi:NADH dehydrogenase/NADH:ubiquinone oxidoreductase subunit G
LIIGSNPRFEASVLNARIRKRFRMANFPIGVIGEQANCAIPTTISVLARTRWLNWLPARASSSAC